VLEYVTPARDDEIADFLASRGGEGGVCSLSLATSGQEAAIDPVRAENARLTLVRA
jgi:hypothetical protein